MYIVASFEHSPYLELAITGLEQKGLPRGHILAIPLKKGLEEKRLLDSIHYADGVSLLDGTAILGTVFMVLGTIYGFVLAWGPIVWSLIGLFAGAGLGLALDLLIGRPRRKRRAAGRQPEVTLIVKCREEQAALVEDLLWQNLALGVGRWSGASPAGV